jgi:hypothetical protein
MKIFPTKVTIRRCLPILRLLEVKLPHYDYVMSDEEHLKAQARTNHSRSKVPVVTNDLHKLLVRFFPGTVGIDID